MDISLLDVSDIDGAATVDCLIFKFRGRHLPYRLDPNSVVYSEGDRFSLSERSRKHVEREEQRQLFRHF